MGGGDPRPGRYWVEQVGRLLQRAVVNRETAKTVGARAGLRIFARENGDNRI